jgi:hypothetical protein
VHKVHVSEYLLAEDWEQGYETLWKDEVHRGNLWRRCPVLCFFFNKSYRLKKKFQLLER